MPCVRRGRGLLRTWATACGVVFLMAMCVYIVIWTRDIQVNLVPTSISRRSNITAVSSSGTPQLFPERAGTPIKVLYWTGLYRHAWHLHEDMDRECPTIKANCHFTTNRSLYNDSDVVVFHIRNEYTLPDYRPPFQKWVFAIQESPMYTDQKFKKQRWLFNITMTYRRLSDVIWYYGQCTQRNATADPVHVIQNYAAGKTQLVAWFVSNCRSASMRECYVEELARSIDVHIYGCGHKYSCPIKRKAYCDGTLLNTTYKFYLSFENSLCSEYITEKVYRILELNVVPIVLGYSNYSDILPPRSFIDVRDYDTPKALAEYLLFLDNNDAMYNEYFRWKGEYTCTKYAYRRAGCVLCEYAHRERGRVTIADVWPWWSRRDSCVSPAAFYGRDVWKTISRINGEHKVKRAERRRMRKMRKSTGRR